MLYENSVVVIGNGESRKSLDLNQLRGHVTLIGCNAIHRDLIVNHLVCCDHRMVQECLNRKKSRKIANVHTRERYFRDYTKLHDNDRVRLLPPLPYEGALKPDQPEHWGSGPYAVLLAAHLNFKTVLMTGFDLHGKNHLVNNVYKDTPNYLEATKSAVDPAYWVYQMRKIFQYHPNTKFKVFNHADWKLPTEWQLGNVEFFDINNFYAGLD